MPKATAIPLDRLVSSKRPPISRLELPFDYDVAEAYEQADLAVRAAEAEHRAARRDPDLTDSKRRLDDARKARDEALEALVPTVRRFLFRAIPLDDFDALLLAHRPTDEQRERFGPDTPYNAETFCPVLVASSLVWTGTGADEWPKGDEIPTRPCYPVEAVEKLWHANDTEGDSAADSDGATNFGPAELEALFNAALSVCRTRRQVDLGKAGTRSGSKPR